MKRFSFPKKLLVGLTSFLFLFVAGIRTAHAAIIDWGNFFGATAGFLLGGPITAIFGFLGAFDWLGDLGGGLFSGLAGTIAQLFVGATVGLISIVLVVIGKIFFNLANGLVELALEINSAISSSTVVQTGFDIVLNIANLGLVVAIVAIAFMVMLRRPGATKLLPRFIAVALLINFSFLIVTNFFLEPVDQITDVLRQAANFDFNSFASTFIPIKDFGTIINNAEIIDTDMDNSGWIAEVAIELISVVFLTTFIIVGVIALTAFAAMLMVRYVALSFLIVMMPIAWVTWIFPNLKIPGGNPFNVWWESFTRWLLFAPISMFFFFLAIQAAVAPDIVDRPIDAEVGTLAEIGIATGNMVLVVGFMLGGLVVANKLSITGASYALGVTKKLGAYARKRSKRELVRMGSAIFRADKMEEPKEGEKKRRIARALSSINPVRKDRMEKLQKAKIPIPLVGRGIKSAGRGVMTATAKSEQYIMAEEMKRFDGLPPYMVAQMYHGLPNDLQKVAALTHMQKNGYTWESSIAEDLGRMKEKGLIEKYGLQKFDIELAGEGIVSDYFETIERNPNASEEELAAVLKKTLDKLSPSDIGKFSPYLFSDYNPKKPQFGFKTEQEFNDYRDLVTNYLVEYRPEAINGLRNRQTGTGQAYVNRTLEKFAGEGGTFEDQLFAHLGDAKKRAGEYIYSVDPKKGTVKFSEATARDKERHIQTHWKEASTDLLKVYNKRIDARTDLDTEGKDKEKKRIETELKSTGPEGFIARHVNHGRARKAGFMFTPFSTDTTSPSEETT